MYNVLNKAFKNDQSIFKCQLSSIKRDAELSSGGFKGAHPGFPLKLSK